MRVLLAIDGSAPSDRARQLVAGILWPSGSLVRVATAVDYHTTFAPVPWLIPSVSETEELERPTLESAHRLVETAVATIRGQRLDVQGTVLRGRPATAIVALAREFRPDLIVVGSRGHGTLQSMLLGSVSAEVVDRAPCPVLVARKGTLASILVADDQSSSARSAVAVLETWPIFRAVPITVLSVSEVPVPWTVGMWAAEDAQLATMYRGRVEDDELNRHFEVAATVEHLRSAGLTATGLVQAGEVAATIVRSAQREHMDLIVVGSGGQAGSPWLALGSVARNVLHHSSASVLVVRKTPVSVKPQLISHAVEVAVGNAFG